MQELSRGTKILLIVSSIIGLGGIVYYLISEKKDSGKSGISVFGIKGIIDYVGQYKINGQSGVWIHFDSESRIKLKGKVQRGDKVTLKNTAVDDVYSVAGTWIDGNGNLGAVLLNPNLPYTPKSQKDTTLKGGQIIFK